MEGPRVRLKYEPSQSKDGLAWAVAEFPHGPTPSTDVLKDEKVKVEVKGNDHMTALAVDTGKIMYKGVSSHDSYVVAVVDKKKRTARVLDGGAVYALSQEVRGFTSKAPRVDSSSNRGQYVQEFASHRELKSLRLYMEARVSDQSVAATKEARAAQDVARSERNAEEDKEESNKDLYIPSHNGSTPDPAAIYPIDTMIFPDLQNAVFDLMVARFGSALEDDDADLGSVLQSVDGNMRDFALVALDACHKRKEREDHRRTVVFTGFVLAMSAYLLDVHPKRSERGKFRSSTFSGECSNAYRYVCSLLDMAFAARADQSNRFVLSDPARVRAINYAVIAMMLSSMDYIVYPRHISSLFFLVDQNSKVHARAVGGKLAVKTVETKGDTVKENVFKLRAPLRLPKPSSRKKKN